MAAISSIDANKIGTFNGGETTLTASDTITYEAAKRQLLVLRNPTGSTVTATIDGADGTTVNVNGLGTVTVSAGYAVAVPAGAVRCVHLNTISHYCQGVVSITGGTGLAAQLFNL